MDTARAKPFEIHVGEPVLADLAARLAATRLPPLQGPPGWDAGASPVYLRALLDHWRERYDWRGEEAKLNRFPQFRAEVNGADIHFIHVRGKGEDPLPLILTHGFPDSFMRFLKLIPLLTDPAAHGGQAGDAFDVVVP